MSKTGHNKTYLSLEWIQSAIPGILLCLFLLTGPAIHGQEENPSATTPDSRFVSSEMVLAPNGAFRGAEGELTVFVDDPPQVFVPFTWHSPAAGIVACSTKAKQCRYDFIYSQRIVFEATSACKAGILDITATNRSDARKPVFLLFSWRPSYSYPSYPLGIALTGEEKTEVQPIQEPSAWNRTSAWFFYQNGFLCDGRVLYLIPGHSGWEKETWVRRPETPYRDLQEQSMIGYTRLRTELPPGASTSVRIVVPYKSLPQSQLDRLTSITRPAG